MSKRTWSRSQRRNYNRTISERRAKKNIVLWIVVLPFFAAWQLLVWCWQGLVWLYKKLMAIIKKDTNAGI